MKRTLPYRVALFALVGLILGLAAQPSLADDGVKPYAVFAELSPETKPMKAGWNTRVFTNTDARRGDGIHCDFTTGLITLDPGTYRISALSMVTYNSGGEPPEMTTIRSPASAGYCRLRVFDPQAAPIPANLRGIENTDPSVICIGSPSSANLVPSLLETCYTTDKPAQILLEHQSGSHPEQIYLRVYIQDSPWHVFARISIQKI